MTGDTNGGLIEKYLRGDLTIAFRRAESAFGEAIQDGFVVLLVNNVVKPVTLGREVSSSDHRFNNKQPLMFSEDIELVDRIENAVAPFIGFRSFDRGSFNGGNPLFAFEHRYAVQKLGLSVTDGEVGLAVGFYAMARENGGHEDIQSRPHRVDDGPDISVNERVEWNVEMGYKQLPFRVLRVRIYDDPVWAAPLPGDESLIHDWDMGIGPMDCG
jgi:hypothetical protein